MIDAEQFLQDWTQENIAATVYGDRATAKDHASKCVGEAQGLDISEAELVEAAGGDEG